MNHMIIIKGAGKTLARAGVVIVLVAALAGIGNVAQIWLSAAVTKGVEQAQEPADWSAQCLDYARSHQVDPEACLPFLSEPAANAVLTTQADMAGEFTYDAGPWGTTVRLPDGTTLYVPIQRDECPLLTLADTSREWCINQADLTPGDDISLGS